MELAKTKAKWIVPQCWRAAELVSWRVPLRLSALCLPCRGIADKRNNCAQKPLDSGLSLHQSLSSLLNAKLNTLARLNVDKSRQQRLLRDCAIHCSTWRPRHNVIF